MSRAKRVRKQKMKRLRRPFEISKREYKLWASKILLITLALLLGGCGVEAEYTDIDGRVFKYKRTGSQQIGEVLLEFPDGSTFLMDGQKSVMPPVKITLSNGIIIESGKVGP